jgi:hypothetical protein
LGVCWRITVLSQPTQRANKRHLLYKPYSHYNKWPWAKSINLFAWENLRTLSPCFDSISCTRKGFKHLFVQNTSGTFCGSVWYLSALRDLRVPGGGDQLYQIKMGFTGMWRGRFQMKKALPTCRLISCTIRISHFVYTFTFFELCVSAKIIFVNCVYLRNWIQCQADHSTFYSLT